jgi:hypothetical protein
MEGHQVTSDRGTTPDIDARCGRRGVRRVGSENEGGPGGVQLAREGRGGRAREATQLHQLAGPTHSSRTKCFSCAHDRFAFALLLAVEPKFLRW